MRMLPRWLDANLAEKGRLQPTALGVNLRLTGLGDGSMTMPAGADGPAMRDWVRVFLPDGESIYYRVTTIAPSYPNEAVYTLTHARDAFSDCLLEQQTEFSGSVASLLQMVIAAQTQQANSLPLWQLGVCECAETWKTSINYTRCSEILEALEEEFDGYCFAYDFTTTPWTLSFVAKPETVCTEFRLSRNTDACQIQLNDNDLCTRLCLSVNKKVTDSGTGVSSNQVVLRVYDNQEAQAVWGIVTKGADIDTGDDFEHSRFPEADAWAQRFLAQRAQPSVQLQITGREWKQLTGDDFDRVTLGQIARVSLPKYASYFAERIVSVQYPDLLGDPTRVSVSLANQLPRFSENVASLQKAASNLAYSSRAGGRSKADAKEITSWSQVVRRTTEAADATGLIDLHESGIVLDADEGVKIYTLAQGMTSFYAGITANEESIESLYTRSGVDRLGQGETLYSKITQNESSISSIVSQSGTVTAVFDPEKAGGYQAGDRVLYNGTAYRFTEAHTGAWNPAHVEAIGNLQSQITQTATGVESLVSKTGINSLGQSETLYSKISQNESGITSLVTKVGNVPTGSNLYSLYEQESGKIAMVVGTNNGTNYIKAAEIATEINGQTGQGIVRIAADKIRIDSSGTIKLSDSITVQGGEVFIEANTVNASNLGATELDVNAVGSLVSFTNGSFYCGSTAVFGNQSTPVEFYGGIRFGGTDAATILASEAGGIIKAVSVANNILTLTKVNGDIVNFSKATAVSGSWSGNTYTVTATQTNRNTTTGQDETVNVGGTPISTTVTISPGTWAYDDDADKYQQTLQIKDEGNNVRQTVYQDLPTVTVSPVLTAAGGTPSAIGLVKAYGPASGSTAYEVGHATVHLQRSNGYVYLTSDNNTPVIGTNVLARISAPAGSITAITGTAISASETELTPTITASGSNVSSLSASLTLANTTYTPQGASAASKCVTLTLGSTLIGRINIDSVYNAGVRAGWTGCYNSIELNPTADATISSAQTVKVFALAASDDDEKTEVDNVTLTPSGGTGTITFTGTDQGDPSRDVNPGTITATATGAATGSENLHITQGSWNTSGKCAVNIRMGSSSGTLIARKWISAPTVSVSTVTKNGATRISSNQCRLGIKITTSSGATATRNIDVTIGASDVTWSIGA